MQYINADLSADNAANYAVAQAAFVAALETEIIMFGGCGWKTYFDFFKYRCQKKILCCKKESFSIITY